MEENLIKIKYKKFTKEQLIELSSEIEKLTQESILILQSELYDRNEKVEVLKVTEQLLSIKYKISENSLFNYVYQLKKDNFSEPEIINLLNNEFGYNESYYKLLKINFHLRGKEDIFNGFILVIGMIFFAFIYIFEIGSIVNEYIKLLILITSVSVIGLGINKIIKGINKLRY